MSWKLLPEQDASAEALCRHKVVLLPGVYHVSEKLHGALEQFVSCGGALVADGQTGLSTIDGKQREECALSDLFGIRFAHVMDAYASAAWGGYMHVTDERFRTFLPDTTPPLGAGQVAAHPIEAAVLAWIVHPCTPLTVKTWVNWWCPPPMTTDSPWPAITRKGLCVWIASEFFRDSGGAMPLNQCLFNGMVSQLLPDPTVRIVTDTAEAISFVMYRRQDSLVVHVVSHLAEKLGGAPPVIESGKLLLGNTHVIRSARQVYPVEKDLSVAEAGMYQEIGLPPIAIHAVICLELQAETGKASASILPGGMRGAAQGR